MIKRGDIIKGVENFENCIIVVSIKKGVGVDEAEIYF